MAARIFDHRPHPHIAARAGTGAPKAAHAVSGFSARLGMRITAAVGTMACAAVFTVIALISLPAALASGQLIVIVAWVAQTFLQLVLLSILMVGGNIASKAADARADSTWKDAEAILAECQSLQAHLQAQDGVLTALIAAQKA